MHEEKIFDCFNDDWTLAVERLGYKALADNVKMLLYQAPPPFSVAVCGGWGSGKTSLLRYMMASTGGRRLCLDPETVYYKTTKEAAVESFDGGEKKWEDYAPEPSDCLPSVWFNPWQHQFEDHPVKALLHEIYNQFSTWGKMKKEGSKIINVLLNTGLRILKDLRLGPLSFPLDVEAIQHAGAAYEEKHFLDPLDSQRFSIAFEQAVAHLANAFKHRREEADIDITLDIDARVIIFVDDLDRCHAGRAFRLLEAIKLFLNTRHCVFVFGIDYRRLAKELACNVPEFDKSEKQASDYLDKMFQALVSLPLPNEADFEKFIRGLGLPEPLDAHVDFLASILERNPRKAKNFINSLVVQMAFKGGIKNQQWDKKETMRHVLMHYLRYYYPDVHRVLENAPQPKVLNELLSVCKDEGGTTNMYSFFKVKMKNELPGAWFESASVANPSLQFSEIPLDMENMNQHVNTFNCRQKFKDAFARSFIQSSDPKPYL